MRKPYFIQWFACWYVKNSNVRSIAFFLGYISLSFDLPPLGLPVDKIDFRHSSVTITIEYEYAILVRSAIAQVPT